MNTRYESCVTFIVPAYNAGSSITACVESILVQTPLVKEIIVVDDGSDDDTLAVLDALRRKHEELVVVSIEHAGAAAARNVGLERARGQFVAFVDSDDVILPGYAVHLVGLMERTRCELAVMDSYTVRDQCVWSTEIVSSDQYLPELMALRRPTSVWAYMFRLEVLRHHRFDPATIIFEDLDFMTRVVASVDQLATTAARLYEYRARSSGLSSRPMGDDWISALAIAPRLRSAWPEYSSAADQFAVHMIRSLVYLTGQLPRRERRVFVRQIEGEARELLPRIITRGGYRYVDRLVVVAAAVSASSASALVAAVRALRSAVRRGRRAETA